MAKKALPLLLRHAYSLWGLAWVADLCFAVALLYGATMAEQRFFLKLATLLFLTAALLLSLPSLTLRRMGWARVKTLAAALLAWAFFLLNVVLDVVLI